MMTPTEFYRHHVCQKTHMAARRCNFHEGAEKAANEAHHLRTIALQSAEMLRRESMIEDRMDDTTPAALRQYAEWINIHACLLDEAQKADRHYRSLKHPITNP